LGIIFFDNPCYNKDMAEKKHVPLPALTADERTAIHRRQVRNQIWIPLILTLLVVFSLVGLAIFGTVQGNSEVNRWGNISAVLLILPTLLTSLISLVIVYFLSRGIAFLLKKTPGWMIRWQALMARISAYFRRFADRVVRPVIQVNGFEAGMKTLGRKIRRNRTA
jgi:hypothetical protein